MRLLLVNSYYQPNVSGGAEISVRLLAEGLAKLGHSVSVLTIQPSGPGQSKMVNGVTVYYVPIGSIPGLKPAKGRDGKIRKILWSIVDSYNLFNGPVLNQVLDSAKPDVVHTHGLSGFSVYSWRAIKSRGLPIVHTLRDMYLICLKSTMFRDGGVCPKPCFRCRLYSIPKMFMARHVDCIIGVSRFILAKHIENGFFRGTDREIVYNSPGTCPSKESVRIPGKFRFGYIGRLDETKGVENLIRSYKKVSGTETELLIAGTGNKLYVDSLKALAGDNQDIVFLGFTDRSSFYSQADIIVVPSKWEEPFGRVIVEAFSHGLPVIGARRGGIPEIVNAENGWLFNPDCEEELVSAMTHCLDNLPEIEKMRSGLVENAGKFSLENSLESHLKIYDQVLRKRTTSCETKSGVSG